MHSHALAGGFVTRSCGVHPFRKQGPERRCRHRITTNFLLHQHAQPGDDHENQPSNEIREANLSYLILAQTMIRADRAEALVRWLTSYPTRCSPASSTSSPRASCSRSPRPICSRRFRFDDRMVEPVLSHAGNGENAQAAGMHAAILMPATLSKRRCDHETQDRPRRSRQIALASDLDPPRRPPQVLESKRRCPASACSSCTRRSSASRRLAACCRSRPTGS